MHKRKNSGSHFGVAIMYSILLLPRLLWADIPQRTVVANQEYCAANGGGSFEWINRISIDGVSHNSSGKGQQSGLDGYSDFTPQTFNLTEGQFSFEPGFSGNPYREHWSVWIDANGNGVFKQMNKYPLDSMVPVRF